MRYVAIAGSPVANGFAVRNVGWRIVATQIARLICFEKSWRQIQIE